MKFLWGWLMAAGVMGAAPLTIEQAVQQSVEKYAAVRVSAEQATGAAAAIKLARTAYLPHVDASAQLNRATRNNIFGMLLPPSPFPGISGPVLNTNSLTNVWGSAVGVTVSWEPFDFGARPAAVDAADVARKRAEAAVARTRFEVATAAADAFLTILAAEQTVVAAKAAVARVGVLEQVVASLVKSGLRSGVDAERTKAEKAAAETQVIQAEQAVALSKAALGQLLAARPGDVAAETGHLLALPPAPDNAAQSVKEHPAVREQSLVIEESLARRKILDRTWYPRFQLQGAMYARGSGAFSDGMTGGAAAGLGPNIQNWGLGMAVTFPVLEQPGLKARKEIESARERTERARYDQMVQDLTGRLDKAQAALEAAQRITRQTPVQSEAARAAELQALARYKAGLGTLVDVADAQRALTQAEIDNSLAILTTWRALLAKAAAEGDLEPFLRRTR